MVPAQPSEEQKVPIPRPAFTIGIEEEYLLVDPVTRNLADGPPEAFMREAEAALGRQVTHEFLRAQIEVGTRVCETLEEAAADIRRLRRTVFEIP